MVKKKCIQWRVAFALNVFVPLLIGCIIYLTIYAGPVIERAESGIWLFGYLRRICYVEFVPKTMVGIFVRNHMCDCLWAYSLGWCNFAAYNLKRDALLVTIGFVLLNEFIQLTDLVVATFDWWDLFFEFIAVAVSFWAHSAFTKKYNSL